MPAPAPAPAAAWTCEQLPFAGSTPVPEASGAGWLEIDGKPVLVVVGDSGEHGAYGLVDPESGKTLEQGTLPLGDAGDDIEGVAGRAGKLYGLTSAGWMRVWTRTAHGFALADGPYPIGPVDPSLPARGGLGDRPPAGDGMVCDAHGVNCGRNYEGLALAPQPSGLCAGYAASKADGHLYCLLERDGRLAVTRDHAIAVDRPGTLADCAYSDDGTLWAGDNLLGLSDVYRITGERAVGVARVGIGFPEVIAVRGDVIYRMSDLGGSPSLMAKFRCRPNAR